MYTSDADGMTVELCLDNVLLAGEMDSFSISM